MNTPGYTRIRKKKSIFQDTSGYTQDTPGYNLRGNPPTFKRKPPQTPYSRDVAEARQAQRGGQTYCRQREARVALAAWSRNRRREGGDWGHEGTDGRDTRARGEAAAGRGREGAGGGVWGPEPCLQNYNQTKPKNRKVVRSIYIHDSTTTVFFVSVVVLATRFKCSSQIPVQLYSVLCTDSSPRIRE